MASKKEYELAVKIAGLVDASLQSSCALTKKQLKEIAKEAASANSETISTADALKKVSPAIDSAWNGLKNAISTTVQAATAAGTAVLGIGTASVSVGKEFETAMSSWRATADANEEEYNKAREAALEMGRTTSKTAKDSANALEYMALAGWSVDDSIKGLPGVLRLSEATEMDLARASDLVTDSMSALGVEIDDLDGYLNIVAKANNKSNQTAEQLMEAYLGVGGTMKNLHVPLAESATAMGVLANRGIKASEGGNAMNAVMINLTTGAGQAGKKMKELGISAFDSNGKFKGLKETLMTVDRAVSGLTEEERNSALSMIGGKQHVDALNALLSGLNTTVSDGKSEWDSLNESLEHADGALEKMAQTKMDNLDGDLAIMESALQDAGIQIYDGLTDPLREGVQFATNLVYEFSGEIATTFKETMPTVRRELRQAGRTFEEFMQPVMSAGEWIIDHPDVIGGGVAAAATTITSAKVAQTLITTATAMKTLGAAMASNPVTATIGVASLAAGAITGVAVQAKIADEQLKKNNLSEHFGNMSLSIDELDKAAEKIIDNGKLGQLNTAIEELDKIKTISNDIEKSQDTLAKLNWKVQMGFDLDESEYASYESSIHQYIEDSIKLAEQQQYAMNLNLDLLLGNDSDGETIKEQFSSFYGQLNSQLQDLGKQLGDAYSEGMKDGVLSMDEVETIQSLQNKMADITQKLSSSKFEASMEVIRTKYSGVEMDAETFQNFQDEIQTQVNIASEKLSESLEMNIQGAKIQLDEGAISQDTYDEMLEKFKEGYQQQVEEIQTQAGSFMTQTIMDGYADEVSTVAPAITGAIEDTMETAFSDMANSDRLAETYGTSLQSIQEAALQAIDTEGLSEGSRLAIEQLLDNMAPTIEQMEEAKKKALQAGKEVPKALADALKDIETLQLVTGSADAIWSYTGEQIANSEQYTATYNKIREIGGTLPSSISQGVLEKKREIEPGIDELYEHVKSYTQSKFKTPIDVSVNISPTYNAGAGIQIGKHAEGGIFDEPHFGVLAEAGPEAYVPLDKSKRSISIWQQAGQMLGVLPDVHQENAEPTTQFILHRNDNENNEMLQPKNRDSGLFENVLKILKIEPDANDRTFIELENDHTTEGSFDLRRAWTGTNDEKKEIPMEPYAGIQKHAEGGIFDEPHFGVLAEAGPEAYVPLDKSKRSISIWQQAGQILGTWNGTTQAQQVPQPITYSPVYQIYGADEQTVKNATRDDQERFEMMMKRYLKDQQRLAF